MTNLDNIRSLYDKSLFLQAYRASAERWTATTQVDDLSIEEMILGSRLAARLGGARLARWMVRKAHDRYPEHPWVRFVDLSFRFRRKWRFDDLRAFEASPELTGGDSTIRAHWHAAHALVWANLRDFERAEESINRSESVSGRDSFVLSCKTQVLGLQGRWAEALVVAESAAEFDSGSPVVVRALGISLLNMGRITDAATRLTAVALRGESFEVALQACWHQSALAETLEGDDRRATLQAAQKIADQIPGLAPLADRETRVAIARMKADLAALNGDHEEMANWASQAKAPFYRKVIENLRQNPGGERIRLHHRKVKQGHMECLPASVSSALSAFGYELDAREMASDVTFGGTQHWRAIEWLEKRGLAVRMFCASPAIAAAMVRKGFSFVLSLETDDFSHAVNVVGLDEAAGTLLLHDPSGFRTVEFLLSSLGKDEFPVGPKAIAIVPRERLATLDELLPSEDSEVLLSLVMHQKEGMQHGTDAARVVAEQLAIKHPHHPLTRFVEAIQARADGDVRGAFYTLQDLLREFPGSSMIRLNLIAACRALGNTSFIRNVLAGIVEVGILPGVQAYQDWRYPPNAYICQYAELLRFAAPSRAYAKLLLKEVLRRQFNVADAWYVLGNIFWHSRDFDSRLLCLSLASCLAENNEQYARSYCDALVNSGRREAGFSWLEKRARKLGASSFGAASCVTWAQALEYWGFPSRANSVCCEALQNHRQSPQVQSYCTSFFVRVGKWEEANGCIASLGTLENKALFEEAAATVHRANGQLGEAAKHAEEWVRCAPHSPQAKLFLIDLEARIRGPQAAFSLVKRWLAANPNNDDLEKLYVSQAVSASVPRFKTDLLLYRRVKRNPEDGWAWRELALRRIDDFEGASEKRQRRMLPKALAVLEQCERTAPEDPAAFRVRARWEEANQRWKQAADHWINSIDLEPSNYFSYPRLWECFQALEDKNRSEILEAMVGALQNCPTRIPFVKEFLLLLSHRLGSAAVEDLADRLSDTRPDDPDVLQAKADLLTSVGHGRSDASRALQILESAVERFPYHFGLRRSLVNASERAGQANRAEAELRETIRRFPGEVAAYLQLATLLDRVRKPREAAQLMKEASDRNPLSPEIWAVRIRMLARNKQFSEARSTIARGIELLPDAANWRATAIALLMECGDPEGAVQVARDGVTKNPRSAFSWLLLGKTLMQARQLAHSGEIESCFRKSLSLNATPAEAVDLLAVTLAEQRKFDDAETLLTSHMPRMPDPSTLRGRLAWIVRLKGRNSEAMADMESVLHNAPSYRWGWATLMDWILQDQAWETARRALRDLPVALRTDQAFRKKRLAVLEKCGGLAQEIETEWQNLLAEFPGDITLHLQRYNVLHSQRRLEESASIIRKIEPLDPGNPFIRARLAEAFIEDQKNADALKVISTIWFQEVETSPWPVDYTWQAAKRAGIQRSLCEDVIRKIEKGSRPAPHALEVIAGQFLFPGKANSTRPNPVWRDWFPSPGARQLLHLLRLFDAKTARDRRLIAVLITGLANGGCQKAVVRYWEQNSAALQSDTEIWALVSICILSLGDKGRGFRHLSDWKERPGVQMCMVTNYVWSSPRLGKGDREHLLNTCEELLTRFQHDHSAKYLAHFLAESQVMLDDQKGLLETAHRYRMLFTGSLAKSEYFEDRQKYLLKDIPRLIDLLQKGKIKSFRWASRALRLKEIPFNVMSRISGA